SPARLLHIGPSPIMNPVVLDSVNGFRKTTPPSHSEMPRRKSLAPPISTSTQSLSRLNSTAAEGPRLNLPPGKPHSPAAPSATTASGSLSFSSAVAMDADRSKADNDAAATVFESIGAPRFHRAPNLPFSTFLRVGREKPNERVGIRPALFHPIFIAVSQPPAMLPLIEQNAC